MKEIKRTPDFTAFIANSTGKGRVSRYSIAKGRTAIVPQSMEFESPEEEEINRGPVSRSMVSDAGVFDGTRKGRMFR